MSFFKSIVVADHRGKLDKFVCQILGHDKWAISLSDNLHDLEENIRCNKHHLIIVNTDIPGFDAVKFMKRLDVLFRGDRPRVIACVSTNISRTLKYGTKAGIDDFVTVPFHGAELLAKVNKQLQFFQSHDNLHAEIQRLKGQIIQERMNVQRLEDAMSIERNRFQIHADSMAPKPIVAEVIESQPLIRDQRKFFVAPEPVASEPDNIVAFDQVRRERSRQIPKPKINASEPEIPAYVKKTVKNRKEPEAIAPPLKQNLPIFKEQKQLEFPVPAPQKSVGSSLLRTKGILLAVKIRGMQDLVEELDTNTAIEMSQLILSSISRVLAVYGGKIVQSYKDIIIVAFQKNRSCLEPGRIACQTAIELERSSFFLEDQCPLLANIRLSMVVHGGVLSFLEYNDSQGIGMLSFGHVLDQTIEILECCPRSTIFVTRSVYGEYPHQLSVKGEMQHHLLCTSDSLVVGELAGCKVMDDGKEMRDEDAVYFPSRGAKFA